MEFRSVIEQAKGILIERHRVTADQAVRLLVAVSMRTDRGLRDLAEGVGHDRRDRRLDGQNRSTALVWATQPPGPARGHRSIGRP